MNTTTITKKGQITVPKDVRDKLDLKVGDKVMLKFVGGKAYIRKVTSIFDLNGSVAVPKAAKKMDWKEIEKKSHIHLAGKVRP